MQLGGDARSAQRGIDTEFSTGTVESVVVWKRKVGGVSLVTCSSLDKRPTNLGSGLFPNKLRLGPV